MVNALPVASRDVVLKAYNKSLQEVFWIAWALCAISSIGCSTLECVKAKKEESNMATVETAAEASQQKPGVQSKGDKANR